MTSTNSTEFQDGDLVEAVKGEERHTGRLTFNSFVKGLILGAPGGSLDWFTKEGFTLTLIERPKPKVELPSEPGYYECEKFPIAQGFAAYRLTAGGFWYGGNGSLAIDNMEGVGKLTRLESRADTAKAVIERIEEDYDPDYSIYLTTDNAREKFGVKA